MKKLLITGLCVLGLYSIPDARASNIAALPLDNTHTTHQVLVPEMPQSVPGSYQVARTYFMPDYQKELTGKRVNDGGANRQDKTCKQYGKKSSCNEAIGEIGKGVSHPLPGLTCYDECVSCSTYGKVAKCLSPQVGENPSQPIKGLKCYDRCVCPGQYKYSESNCIAPAVLGGDICLKNGGLLTGFSSTSSTPKPSSLTSSAQRGAGALYTECTCSDEYKFDYKLTGEICTSCTGQKGTIFGTFYKCTTCTGFDLRKCPIGGNCSQCMYDHTKLKLSGCNASMGYTMSATGLDCVAMSCPVGYSNTISACASGSTKPDLACSGMSGGNKCCLCKCNNINSSCTAAIYPYTSVPANATKTAECSTGCGSEKVTRYKIKCNSGYVLKNGKCLSDTCPTGYSKTACASGYKQTDTKPTEAGTTCYKCEMPTKTCEQIAVEKGYEKEDLTNGPAGYREITVEEFNYIYAENVIKISDSPECYVSESMTPCMQDGLYSANDIAGNTKCYVQDETRPECYRDKHKRPVFVEATRDWRKNTRLNTDSFANACYNDWGEKCQINDRGKPGGWFYYSSGYFVQSDKEKAAKVNRSACYMIHIGCHYKVDGQDVYAAAPLQCGRMSSGSYYDVPADDDGSFWCAAVLVEEKDADGCSIVKVDEEQRCDGGRRVEMNYDGETISKITKLCQRVSSDFKLCGPSDDWDYSRSTQLCSQVNSGSGSSGSSGGLLTKSEWE